MTPLTLTLLCAIPAAAVWFPLTWRYMVGPFSAPGFSYHLGFAYLLSFALQHAGQVFSGRVASLEDGSLLMYLVVVPPAASWMSAQLAIARRHAPLKAGSL